MGLVGLSAVFPNMGRFGASINLEGIASSSPWWEHSCVCQWHAQNINPNGVVSIRYVVNQSRTDWTER